jgi:type IX secretion system PorP/SprF family membrane protein
VETKFGLGESSNDYLSVGLQVTNDLAGDSRMGKTQLLPMITYHKSVSGNEDTYISLGFLGGAVNQRFDPTKLSFDDQFIGGAYSPTNPTRQTFANTNITYWDAAAGMSFSSVFGNDNRFYLGASYFHFNQPKVAFDRTHDVRLNRKWVVSAGLSAPTGESDRISFYGDYFIQGGHEQAQGGVMYQHNLLQQYEEEAIALSAGVFYRWNDAVVPLIKLDYYAFGLGLTYDVNVSKLKPASNLRGGFELTLSYKNFLNIKNSSADKVRCPISFD